MGENGQIFHLPLLNLSLTKLLVFFNCLFIIFPFICVSFCRRDSTGTDKVNFILTFSGEQDPALVTLIKGLLIENAPRVTVNGQITLKVGPLYVFESDLAIEQATVSMTSQGSGSTGPTGTTLPASKYMLFYTSQLVLK